MGNSPPTSAMGLIYDTEWDLLRIRVSEKESPLMKRGVLQKISMVLRALYAERQTGISGLVRRKEFRLGRPDDYGYSKKLGEMAR